ncbi:MAG: class I SAM-dependent methyltransferase [Dokdonella sp.]
MARVCLNMIVKNEAAIIERCLAAVVPYIDCYVICDTGSTDGTVELIRNYFDRRGIPGILPTKTFRNFEQARNEALDAARASALQFDYILLCDADMDLQVSRGDFRDHLSGPVYSITQRTAGGLEYPNVRLFRRDIEARYQGVTHEYLNVGDLARPVLEGVSYVDHASGANRAGKFERDIELLAEGLRLEPDNARYVFYTANSHYDLGNCSEAMSWYARREAMGGWQEEIFYSSYRIGLCLQHLGREDEAISRLLETYDRFPWRAEPLHLLALHYQRKARHRLAHWIADTGCRVLPPTAGLFVETDVYTWRLKDIVAVSLFWLDRRMESAALNRDLLGTAPASEHARIEKNLAFCAGDVGKDCIVPPEPPCTADAHPWDKYEGLKLWGWYIDQMDLWKQHLFAKEPARILEIGAFDGVSANMMLDTIFVNRQSHLVAIDPFLPDSTTPEVGEGTHQTFLRNADIGNHRDRISLLHGFSFDLLHGMPPESFDFIYVDGSHLARHVIEDAVLAMRLLKPGGVIGFDDYVWTSPTNPVNPCASPKAAIDAFEAAYKDQLELLFSTRQRFYRRRADAVIA